MATISGLMGAICAIEDATPSGTFDASVTVSGFASSDFDSKLIVSRTDSVSQFDAKVTVVQQAEELLPTVTIDTPTAANASGVPPYYVAFTGSATASGARDIVKYTWFFNDINTTISGGPTSEHIFAESGEYIVTLRAMDSEGFYGFDTVRVLTHSGVSITLPDLQVSGIPQSGNTALVVDFEASGGAVAGSTIDGYGWSFGHGKFSTRQNPSGINFALPGKYVPVCTIVDSRNFKMADSLEIGVNN